MRCKYSLCVVLFCLILVLAGCQVDLNGSVGTRAFYPDKIGKKNDIGDPRKPIYQDPGYHEENKAGNEASKRGFVGMNEGRK